ncbi:Histone H1/H5 [Artemisia annua]|uniref:Histone H1/H5 n=1 Tax=Artemisia annua TaxID=35608 RepID=A0A2U1KP97_ARTAN|nr:Histone H1/H5 [Artemisia annua]
MLEGVAENPSVNSPEPSSAVLFLEYGDTAKPSSSLMDRKSAPDYEAMIFEALCCTVDPNGPDINAILSFINQKFDVPENFKTSVTSKLRRLVLT